MMLRLIDANLNRLSEGLRLLEDVSRFLLNDAATSAKLKSLRHDLSAGDPALHKALLSARNVEGDVAALTEEERGRADIPAIVAANARRASESLRVLEEFAKLPDSALDPERFKRARFAIYDIERELAGKVMRHDKRVAGLYTIIDSDMLMDRDEREVCQQMISGGADGIQLRDKKRGKRELMDAAQGLQEICAKSNVIFSVNDYLDIALAAGTDGLHLGQGDIPIPIARRLLPIDKLLGCSTHTLEQALQAEAHGADYIAVGSIYPTQTKNDAIEVGLEHLRRVREAVSLPIVAIGGINADNAPAVFDAGADAIAVIGAALGAEDVEAATRKLAQRVEAARTGDGQG